MNVSLMPLSSQTILPKMELLNPEKALNPVGPEGPKNDFTELLGDFERKGKNIDPSNFKNIFFEKNSLKTEEGGKKPPIAQNILLENFRLREKIGDKEMDDLGKKFDPLNKLESNELFLFQRELANKTGTKNDSIHTFSKIFNVEKKDKKPEIIESGEIISNVENNNKKPKIVQNGETIGNIENNNKKLEGILKDNHVAEQSLKFTSPKELFNWISKVISKSQIKSGETLNLQIRDNYLGEFNISAQNGAKGGEINMSIVSQTKESDEFFRTNEKDLIKSLENAGVKIGKIEILTADSSKAHTNNENMSDNKGSLSESVDNHFSQKDQLERDGQRRREIWNRFRDLRES